MLKRKETRKGQARVDAVRKILLNKDERIITAYAEPASGPGWANQPIWVVVMDSNKDLRLECIQPNEQTSEMQILYRSSAAAHVEMTSAVSRANRG